MKLLIVLTKLEAAVVRD